MAYEFLAGPVYARDNRATDIIERLIASMPSTYDTTQGSIVYDLLASFAVELETAYQTLDAVAAQAYPQTATDSALDALANSFALERLVAATAVCTLTFTGTAGTEIGLGTRVSTLSPDPQTGDVIVFETDEEVTIGGGGTVTVTATAVLPGIAGNVSAAALTVLETEIDGVTVTNAAATGGRDEEDDEGLRGRLLAALSGARGAGTATDYEAWALEVSGVASAFVEPLWNGNGTVRVTVSDASDAPVSQAALTEVTALIEARAPVGADVTVITPATLAVKVSALLTLEAGYSIAAVQGSLEDALEAYYRDLAPGATVYLSQVSALLAKTPHVVDVSTVQLATAGAFSAANVVLPSGTKAVLGTPPLTLAYI